MVKSTKTCVCVNDIIVGIVTYTTYNTMGIVVFPYSVIIPSKCLMRDIRYPKEATYTTCDDRHCGSHNALP